MDYPQKCLPQNCLPVGKSEVGIIIITHHQKCLPQLYYYIFKCECPAALVCDWMVVRNCFQPTRSRMRLRFSDKIFFQHNVEYQTQQIRSFLIRVNCTLNKKVATELVKELSKICSFTYVFKKKALSPQHRKRFNDSWQFVQPMQWRRQCGHVAIGGPCAPLLATYPGEGRLTSEAYLVL